MAMLRRLPLNIQAQAEGAFRLWQEDRWHPMLEAHQLADSGRGRHRRASIAVSITGRYRAIYVVEPHRRDGVQTAVWYWIGSHEDYNGFVGARG